MAAIASALVGPVASLFSGLFGSAAAKKAAGVEQQGAENAQNLIAKNQNQALGIEQGAQSTNAQNEQPFLSAGQNAVGSLSQLLQNGSLTPAQFQAPTVNAPNSAQSFAEQQGLTALQNSAAARGGLLTGGTAQALEQTAAGYGSQFYQQDYNNAVQNYQLGLQAQNQQYSQLAGVAGLGLNSANEIGSVDTNLSGQQASTLNSGGQQQAQQIDAAAAAQAAGILGSGSALSSIFGSVGSGVSGVLGALNQSSRGSSYGGGGQSASIPDTGSLLAGGPMAPSMWYARGGHTTAKKPIIVGEEGPELFIPDKDGFVLPHNSLRALLAKRAA